MRRLLSGTTMGLALLALAVQTRPGSAGQLNLLPILQISGTYSDNVFFQTNNPRSDMYFVVNPGIALDYASRNFVGSVSYQVGLQRNNDFSSRDNNVHRVDASVGFALSHGWYIDANDNLYITSDPLAYDASGDRLQRDSFTYNRFIPSVSYTFSSKGLRMGARYDRTDVDYHTLTDSFQNGLGGNVSAKLGARSTLDFDYFEFKREFQHQDVRFNVINYTGRRFGVKVDRKLAAHLSANGYVGYEDRKFELDAEARNYDSMLYSAALTGEFPDVVSWSLGGSQRLNDLAIEGVYKVRRVTVDLRKSLMDRLRLDGAAYYQKSDNDFLGEKANFWGARLEGQYMVAKFLNIWLGYDYLKRDSDNSSLAPFKENRVNFGLTLSYGL